MDENLDFNDMEENHEEDGFEPTGESDNSQEPDKDGNINDKYNPSSDSSEQGNESYENLNSESTSTVLVCENAEEEGENLQNDDQDHEEIEEINQDELDKEIEKELEEGVEPINQYLEEEAEFINAYQEMVEQARELDEELKHEGEEPLKTEEEWEKEVETAAYSAEQLYGSTKELEADNNTEDVSEINEEHEIEKETQQSNEVSETQMSDLKEELSDLEEERDEVEQHQVEPYIEEALETEPEPKVDDKEIEELQEMDLEEQFQTVHDKEYIEELVETQLEMEQLKEQEVEAQVDNSKEKVSELEEELKDGRDEIEQHQVEDAIEEELETEPEAIINEKEIEELQEMDLEEQFQKVGFNEYIEELVEKQEEEKIQEHDKIEQEQEHIEQTQEVLHQSTYLQEKLEEQELELELEYEEKDEVEQHQVEAAIEEELETEPKPIIHEEELEYVKNFEPERQLDAELLYELIEELVEKQKEEKEKLEENEEQEEISTEMKVAQIKRELEIDQEISSGEAEVEVIITKQEPLIENEQEEELTEETTEEKCEAAKKLYTQQTGKRPIYAKTETKGFNQWLEQQQQKSTGKEKTKQEKEPTKGQKKEEPWKWTMKNWIELTNEIDPELKSELKKIVEKYNELEKLIKKYLELYNKAKSGELSPVEKTELKSLNKVFQKLNSINIELFVGLRQMKQYLDDQYFYDFWDKPLVSRVQHHFFSRLAQTYKDLKEAHKKEKVEEILKNWITNASEEKINPKTKVLLKEIVENYNELDAMSIRFMELYRKNQNSQISEKEKNELKLLNKSLQKIDPTIIETFSKIRAFTRYLNDHNFNLEKRQYNRILYRFFASSKQTSPTPSNSLKFTPLTSQQIQKYEQKYQKILEELCVQYALDFKNILIKEYGKNIMEMNIPLSTHFDFRLDKYIRKVSHFKRDRAVGVGILERAREHIVKEYNTWDKDWAKESSFKRVMDFIKEYKEFSNNVSGKSGQGMFSISNIKYDQNSKKLVPKSWLLENLRYLFPKKFGLPLSDNLLSSFIFDDTPTYGRVSKLKWTTEGKELLKRINLSELLSLEYNISNLTEKAFSDKGIEISNRDLETLKKKVSFLIYYYFFGGYHESTYVSKTTNKKLEVGKNFFIIEYKIVRAIFFAATEANNGKPLNFEELQRASGTSDLKNHLAEGFGFGDSLDKLRKYLNELSINRPPDSNSQIFQDAKDLFDGYHDKYRAKYRAFQKTRKSKTKFQGIVHKEVDRVLGLHLAPETQVRAVVKEKYVDTINLDGVKENIYVHGAFKFDGYHDLSSALKKYLGLNDKWMGIAFEALGTYWHRLPAQKEADRKKRLICKEKNIIMIEIWEDYSSNTWGSEIIDQIKQKTGVEIPRNKLGDLAKFLGI